MNQVLNIVCIFIHLCDIGNIYYLLLILYAALVLFWVEDYPLSVWLLNPFIYSFFSRGVIAIGGMQTCIVSVSYTHLTLPTNREV